MSVEHGYREMDEASDYWDALIDQREAARFADVSVRTLEGWRLRGTGPRYAKVGPLVRYTRRWLRDYGVRNVTAA